MLTLAQAAAMTGMNRSSILRAIKRGALTGSKDHNEVWHVDGAELARVFPITPPNAQAAPPDTHPDAVAAYKLALTEERIAELKGRLEEMRQEARPRTRRRGCMESSVRSGDAPDRAARARRRASRAAARTALRRAVTIAPRLAMDAGDRMPCGRELVARLGDRGCSRSATAAAATAPSARMLHG